jgi:chromosome partitioning protein
MIIICDKCKTRFQLDDSLIKKTLFKVRCSKCQHVFSVDTSPKDEIVELQQPIVTVEKKIIAICNQKGGVAKTSTCLNLGASLSLSGKRVLLVDFDVQTNLSMLLGKNNEASFYEIYQKQLDIQNCIKKIHPGLWLMPANSRIALLAKLAFQQQNGLGFFLRDTLESVKSHFDCILIDTPPSVKFFTPNALMAADFVIIPTQSEFLAMNGVMQMENIIQAIQPMHPLDYRILVTMYDDRNIASKVIYAKLRDKYKDRLFDTYISADYKMQESQIVNKPVVYYDENAVSARQYRELAKQIQTILL